MLLQQELHVSAIKYKQTFALRLSNMLMQLQVTLTVNSIPYRLMTA